MVGMGGTWAMADMGGTMSMLLVGLVLELLPPWPESALSRLGGGSMLLVLVLPWAGNIMAGLITGTLETLLEAGL